MTNWQAFWICFFAYLIVVVIVDYLDEANDD